jgi:hypothetical protein
MRITVSRSARANAPVAAGEQPLLVDGLHVRAVDRRGDAQQLGQAKLHVRPQVGGTGLGAVQTPEGPYGERTHLGLRILLLGQCVDQLQDPQADRNRPQRASEAVKRLDVAALA